MQVNVSIGQNHHFALREALLIYRSTENQNGSFGNTFITHHEVNADNRAKQPTLGPAKTLTIEFVQSLVQALGGRVQAEFLPTSVIARTERLIAWWTPPQMRPMFFGTTQGDMAGMNGAIFPQPALVWLAMDHSLSIRALKENRRPVADTKLCVAPYWNVYDTGSVCLGSMRAPDTSTVASLPQWEKSFYESEFTHGNVGRLTRHPGGFEGLWKELAGKKKFPSASLIELPETAEEFLPERGAVMITEHALPKPLCTRGQPLRVLIVGAGGNGSAVLLGLPYLHQAMKVWGHTGGLHVMLADGDLVSETNCVRQPFASADVGLNKAVVLINRVNLFWGLRWQAHPEHFHKDSLRTHSAGPHLILGCVDTRAARQAILSAVTQANDSTVYWLDLGNNASSGQYVLGQPLNAANRRNAARLRTVAELYPEIADAEAGEDPLPSCSAAEALVRQEPFVNQVLATSALAMLARLFRYGILTHHGAFYNAETGRMAALPVDPRMWERLRRRNRNAQSRVEKKSR